MIDLIPLFIIVCTTILLVALLYFLYKHHSNVQLTLQKFIEKDKDIPEVLLETLKKPVQKNRDFRKGVMFTAVGSVLTIVFFMIGGNSWIIGLIPIVIGLAYLGLSKTTSQ